MDQLIRCLNLVGRNLLSGVLAREPVVGVSLRQEGDLVGDGTADLEIDFVENQLGFLNLVYRNRVGDRRLVVDFDVLLSGRFPARLAVHVCLRCRHALLSLFR